MKKYYTYIKSLFAFVLFSMLVITACNDSDLLDITNPNDILPETFYQTEGDAILAVNSVYAVWQSRELAKRFYFFGNDMPSDESIGTNNLQAALRQMLDFTWTSNNNVIRGMWGGYYRGINAANTVLAEVPDIDMDADLKNRILGEARFLRAVFYFDLVNKWGAVPLLTEPVTSTQGVDAPRSPESEIYELIIEDLEFARDNLPTRDEYDDSDLGRATSGAAASYLGKVHLYLQNWAEAEAGFDAVIAGQFGTYDLVDNFRWNGIGEEQVSEAENSMESLFEIQFQDDLGSLWGTDQAGGGENTFRGVEYAFASFNNVRPKQAFADRFELGDPRYEQTFYDDSVRWFQGVFSREEFGGLIAWRKYQNYDIRDDRNQSSGINFRLMRFADVLLMAAEAKLNNGKPFNEVLDLVNRVRQRAIDQKTNPDIELYMERTLNNTLELYPTAQYPADNAEEVMTIIMHERAVELAGEQHRYNDLRRWGLDDDIAIADGKPYQVGRNELWPIPQQELETNPSISQADQNPGY